MMAFTLSSRPSPRNKYLPQRKATFPHPGYMVTRTEVLVETGTSVSVVAKTHAV